MSRSRQALRLLAVTTVVCGSLWSSAAFADGPSAAQEAQAEDLFQRSKTLMAQKDYHAACPMLAESYRLAGGGGTLQNLAICYEEEGKVAFAYNRFLELRTLSIKAGRQDRVALADEHIAKLKERISRLVIRVPEASRVPGLKVAIDGDDYGEASWSAGIVLNTGSHVVKFSAPGKKSVEVKKRIEDERLLESLDAPPLVDLPRETTVAPPGASLDELDRVASRRALRTTGFVIGGIGLGVAVAGGVFGLLTITTNNAAKNACRDNTPGMALSTKGSFDTGLAFDANGACFSDSGPARTAQELHDRARTFGTVSTVLVPVGLFALGLGTYFVYSSSGEGPIKGARAGLVPTLGGASLVGEFQ